MNGYRKELKYIVGDDVLLDVRNRISGLMRPDEHQRGDYYRIRSVYFDSPVYACYRENLAGISSREKYRIRTYNCSDSAIMAEIKIRHAGTISKMSAKIDRKMYEKLISSDFSVRCEAFSIPRDYESDSMRHVMEKYLVRITNQGFCPAVIVDYERTAYVYDICNVRITFDRNLTAYGDFNRMFEQNLPGRAVLDGGMQILEIKYDEFLPDEIRTALSGAGLKRTSCSKYAKCLETLRF